MAKLLFSVSDRAEGHEVTPEAVPLGLLKEFVKDVATFIRGDDKEIDTSDLIVSVVTGSLALQSHEELSEGLSIWHDIERLANGRLDGIDPKRASVAEKWRVEAMKRPTRTFRISDVANVRVVAINANTFFTRELQSNWVLVERYLTGVVEDFGGATAANIHLRLEDGSSMKIDATRDQIREQELNPVYHTVVMRVELEEDLVTGEKRGARFLGFADYDPRIDDDEYNEAIEAGRVAWKDVGDAADWVRKIRGGRE
ncbi:hypothetical protein J2X06_002459 [Lysobacter niastensis]|uniref:Uncharacterized protein n=1 Tax=Lysobacter niastensis TaxID=380629 RepID=A0ABU1WD19_9GAMM|nr:hypothetical protein [Lysobacter niastensis]MDR7135250.1 hypothetical protein [Lysobacter niastensis]